MAKTKLYKGSDVIFVASGQVAYHEALGWKQNPPVVLAGDALSVGGTPILTEAAELNDLACPDVDAGTLENVHMRHYQVTPDAPSATAIHADIALTTAVQAITTGITNPDVPRTLTIKGNASGITGNVVIKGTNVDDEAISDTIALNGTSEVEGVKAFKTVTSIQVPVESHAPDVAQVESAAVVGGPISTSGNAAVVVTAAGMSNSPKTVNVAVSQGVKQVETATVVGGPISTSGDAAVVVTADGMSNSPKSVAVAVVAGTLQVETATVVGTITGAGFADVVVTADGMSGSPLTCKVYVDVDDTAAVVATKIRAELNTHTEITDLFTVSGTDANVILTAKTKAANDATLNISIDNDTCTGLTTAATSANTTAGVVADTAAVVGGKIRTALGLDADVSAFFTVSGEDENVILTAKAAADDDATMNISIDNGTCAGLTTAATSTNTTAGVYDALSVGMASKIGLPHIVDYAACLILALFGGSADTGGSLAVDADEVEKNLYTPAGTLDGSTALDLYYLA